MSFTAEGTRIKRKAFLDADDLSLQASGAFRVEFDVSENELHRSSARVTKHPIEAGATVADHVAQDPDTLDLVAKVTNTPIVSEADAFVLTPGRVDEAYNTLRRVKETATLITVFTTLRTYVSMVITEVTITRNAPMGDALALALKVEHLRTATSETISLPQPRDARAKTSQNLGKVTTPAASDAVAAKAQENIDRTILNNVLGGFVP